ncbi:MAG: hypothetical protein OQK27_03195 [Gammaproteobacteria bacterium]|nr:hypothetical protein [Gammaproteobacteria bacterium]
MISEQYPYKVAAIYADAESADAAVGMLEHAGLGDARIVRLRPGQAGIDSAIEPESVGTRDTVTVDTLTGGIAGAGAGALVAGAVTALTPALFVSAPVVAPLIILGYGTLIGGTAGAVRGVRLRELALAGLVKDALKAGYQVVLVHSASEQIRDRAQAVIGETMAENTAHA